jgi:hypothetical protein
MLFESRLNTDKFKSDWKIKIEIFQREAHSPTLPARQTIKNTKMKSYSF